MLLLSKTISQLLLPPGGLILLATLGLIFWKKPWGRPLIALSLSLFWLLSTEPVRDALTSSLEYQYPAFQLEKVNNPHTAIVLLGGGIQANSLEYNGGDTLNDLTMMRTIYAAKVAKATGYKIYATGGSPLRENTKSEAAIMKQWLVWFGIDEKRVHTESLSNTTWENALLTKKMLTPHGINSIVLVTSAWHMPRSVWCFEQHGLKVIPAPTAYLTKQEPYDLRSFFPRWGVFSDSGDALHEYLGLVWYKLKY